MNILIVLGALVVVFAVNTVVSNGKPKIELGLVNGKLKEIPNKKNAVSTETLFQDKLIPALKLKSSSQASKDAMKKALSAYGDIEIIEEKKDYIYAVATTGKMKYHDDIEIYFDELNNRVQYRSASRAGYGDMGLNLERYNKISEVYEKN